MINITILDLDHLLQQVVDEVLSVTVVTTLDEVVSLLLPATGGITELEGPEEVAGVFKVGSDSENLVDKILATDDVLLLQYLLDNLVRGDWDTLSFHLHVSSLVDKLPDSGQVRSSPCNKRLTNTEHVDGGLVQLDEHSIVDLSQTEKLEDLLDLGCDLVDTTDTHDKSKLRLGRHIKVTSLLSVTRQPLLVNLLCSVFLNILLSTLEVLNFLLLRLDSFVGCRFSPLGSKLCLALALLEDIFWNRGKTVSHFTHFVTEINKGYC